LKIRKILIDRAVSDYIETRSICRRVNRPAEYADDLEGLFREINESKDPQSAGKRVLLLTRNKGDFIRMCPGTTHYTCCNYKILHIGSYCSMDCSYCILQAYFHPPLLTFFVNHDEMERSLSALFLSHGIHRVGTGEFTDSLIWESIYPLAKKLVLRFAQSQNAVLELKTKTASVDHLLDIEHMGKTIMAWSLNTEAVIASQERGTASLDERIDAAALCQARGYPLAFHFDPMIWYDGCVSDYASVVDKLIHRIDPAGIVWISLGSFRFMPNLNDIIIRRYPRSRIVYGEFIRGFDNKMRYFKPLRIRLYRSIVDRLKHAAPNTTLYFCMEDDEVWTRVLGYPPADWGGLPNILDMSAVRHCGLTG